MSLTKNELNLVLIGVYMPFDDGSADSKAQFETNISILSALIKNCVDLNNPVLITGDFNADLNRKKRFDSILLEFMKEYSLISLDSIFNSSMTPTYPATMLINSYTNTRTMYYANLDHMIVPKQIDANKIEILNCTINNDIINTSDHNSLSLKFRLMYSKQNQQSEPEKRNIINFDDEELNIFYKDQIEELSLVVYNKYFTSNQHKSIDVDHLYNDLCQVLLNASSRTNKWFSPELKLIKEEIMQLKHSKNNNNNSIKIKELKSKFRSVQRRNIWLQRLSENEELEKIAQSKDKNILLAAQNESLRLSECWH